MIKTKNTPAMTHTVEVRRTLTAAELIELDITGIKEFDTCYIDYETGELVVKGSTAIYIVEEQ